MTKDVELTSGRSEITFYTGLPAGETSADVVYAGANGSGSIRSIITDYRSGQSTVSQNNPNPNGSWSNNVAFLSGKDGTGLYQEQITNFAPGRVSVLTGDHNQANPQALSQVIVFDTRGAPALTQTYSGSNGNGNPLHTFTGAGVYGFNGGLSAPETGGAASAGGSGTGGGGAWGYDDPLLYGGEAFNPGGY